MSQARALTLAAVAMFALGAFVALAANALDVSGGVGALMFVAATALAGLLGGRLAEVLPRPGSR